MPRPREISDELTVRLQAAEAELEKNFAEFTRLMPLQSIRHRWESTRDFLPFTSLIGGASDQLMRPGMSEDKRYAFAQMLLAVNDYDHITKFDKAHFKELDRALLDYYHVVCELPGNELMNRPLCFYSTADISNLGGLNSFLIARVKDDYIQNRGQEGEAPEEVRRRIESDDELRNSLEREAMGIANELLSTFANIYKKHIVEALGRVPASSTAEFYRDGGDEFSSMILVKPRRSGQGGGERRPVSIPGKHIMRIPGASPRKDPYIHDDSSWSQLWSKAYSQEAESESEVVERLDKAIGEAREEISDLIVRLGLSEIPHPKHTRGIERILRRGVGIAASFKEYKPGMSFEEVSAELDTDIARQRLARTVQQGFLGPLTPPMDEFLDTLRHHPSYSDCEEDIHPFPFEGVKVEASLANWSRPHEVRRQQINAVARELRMSRAEQAMFKKIYALFEAHDTLTGCRKDAVFPEVMSAVGHTLRTGKPDHSLAVFDIQNFGGLNEVYGHLGCDEHFKAITDRIAAALIREGVIKNVEELQRPNGSGSKIYLVTRSLNPDRVKSAIEAAEASALEYARDQGLADLPNPKYPGKHGVECLSLCLPIEPVRGMSSRLAATLILDTFDSEFHVAKQRRGYVASQAKPVEGDYTAALDAERQNLHSSPENLRL